MASWGAGWPCDPDLGFLGQGGMPNMYIGGGVIIQAEDGLRGEPLHVFEGQWRVGYLGGKDGSFLSHAPLPDDTKWHLAGGSPELQIFRRIGPQRLACHPSTLSASLRIPESA